MSQSRVKLSAGAEVFENQGIACYTYNAKLYVAGDVVKVVYYEKGVTCGFLKHELEGEEKERAKAEYDREARYEKTCKSARQRVHGLVACNLHRHKDHHGKKQSFKFVTLTFRADVKKLDEANRLFKKFIMRLNYHFTGDEGEAFLKYVAVPELQMENSRYVWHYHVLFFNLPFLPVSGEMVDKLVEDKRLQADYDKRDTLFYIWGNGSVDVCKVDFSDSYDVAAYVSKYIAKGLDGVFEYADCENILYKKRYLCSRGLLNPRVIIAFLDKAKRQEIFNYFQRHSKHFKRKGVIGLCFSTYTVDSDFLGRVFGIDFRAGHKHVRGLIGLFDRFSYGFC